MSAIPPPAANEHFEPPSLDLGDSRMIAPSVRSVRTSKSVLDFGKWRRVVGMLLLALTIFGWTSTNFLASVCSRIATCW